jgi:hypothetical protein
MLVVELLKNTRASDGMCSRISISSKRCDLHMHKCKHQLVSLIVRQALTCVVVLLPVKLMGGMHAWDYCW